MTARRPRLTPADAVAAVRDVLRDRGLDVEVSPETDLDGLGLESREVVEVFVLLEDRTGCVVSTQDFESLRVVGDIASLGCLDESPGAS